MAVDLTSIDAVWWQQIPGGGDVYYQPPDPANSRWQRGSTVEGLYFADCEETAWAEWYRFLAEAGVPPSMALPRDLWQWQIEIEGVASQPRSASNRSAYLSRSQEDRSGLCFKRLASDSSKRATPGSWLPRPPAPPALSFVFFGPKKGLRERLRCHLPTSDANLYLFREE